MRKIDHRRFKNELYTELARIGSSVASPKRLEILDLLAQRERSVEDLANELGLSVANTSQHLRVLNAARLVEVDRRGTFAHYRLANVAVFRLVRAIDEAGEACLPEVAATLARHVGRRKVEKLDLGAIARRVKSGSAILLDVRPEPEYRSGHIPGARTLPIETLTHQDGTHDLPRDREIVVYCRGPYCVWADEAVDVLIRRGFKARRLLLGAPDWTALGERLETVV